jgi:hypothetical protein
MVKATMASRPRIAATVPPMPRLAPRWVTVTVVALLALAVLVMHGAFATAHHTEARHAGDPHLPSLQAVHDDCHGCMPTHHLAAICVAVVGAAVVWRAARVLDGRRTLPRTTTLVWSSVEEARIALPHQPDPPWLRLAVIRR